MATPYRTETGLTFRQPAGIALHSTEAPDLPNPSPNSSWHDLLGRRGELIHAVDFADVAWHVKAWGSDPTINRWRPSWLPLTRPWDASATNCHTIGLEIHSNQTYRDQGVPYTQAQYRALQQWLLDRRDEFGPLPIVGHTHLQTDKHDPWWLDWQQVIAVLPEVDRWMPLEDAKRSDPLQGGYAFTQWTGSVFHPGVDLNAGSGGDADLGKPIRTPVAGVVQAVRFDPAGYGNHLWLEAETGHWLHFCHLRDSPTPLEGEWLKRGAVVDRCGKSGGWPWAHLHWEVLFAKPNGWSQWPVGWSKTRVLDTYLDPFAYLAATWPDAGQQGPIMETPILSDDELEQEARRVLWGAFYIEGTADFAIPKRWKAELRLGNDLGAPLTGEQSLPGGAVVQRFERGAIYYRSGKTTLIG